GEACEARARSSGQAARAHLQPRARHPAGDAGRDGAGRRRLRAPRVGVMSASAVVLAAHGTVDSQDELPELLANIRRGKPVPPELLAEVRRRYQAIGGKSPLNDINREVAQKLEAKLGMPVRLANRLFKPDPKDVLGE